jgi:NAD(P)-dependent dehydrogenase (short-subunit alcohol dehydrogenase family)
MVDDDGRTEVGHGRSVGVPTEARRGTTSVPSATVSVVADVVDRVLELPVAPSFTRIGPAVRGRLEHWQHDWDLRGRVVVVTGATSGIGLAATRALLAAGATVELVARDAAKAARVASELEHDAPGRVDVVVADTGDLDAVRSAAAALLPRRPRIDVLVHNAGALDAHYGASPQGLEQTVASQVVGPFLLTALLLPALRAARPGRVLWVASGGMYTEPLAVERLEMAPDGYDGTTAYARAKRAQVTLAELWAARLPADEVVVHAMHPGWADTPGVVRSLPTFHRVVGPLLRTPAAGADTLLWLAASDGAPRTSTGGFWHDRRRRSPHRLPSTRRADTGAERDALWRWCCDRAGVEP